MPFFVLCFQSFNQLLQNVRQHKRDEDNILHAGATARPHSKYRLHFRPPAVATNCFFAGYDANLSL